MAAQRIRSKKIDLGHGWVYHEIVKPTKHTIHNLKQYISHEEDCTSSRVIDNEIDNEFVCWVCGKEVPQEVIEKAMTIFSMRVM